MHEYKNIGLSYKDVCSDPVAIYNLLLSIMLHGYCESATPPHQEGN
jgi:hypothetical protein